MEHCVVLHTNLITAVQAIITFAVFMHAVHWFSYFLVVKVLIFKVVKLVTRLSYFKLVNVL